MENHNTSQLTELIESMFSAENMKKYELPRLYDLYENFRYRYMTASAVYEYMKNDFRFDTIRGMLPEEMFTNWYNEMLRINPPTITIGMPCTVYYYSDRRAATITKIEYYKDGRKDAAGNRIPRLLGTNLNEVKCIDHFKGEYEVIPMTDPGKLKLVHDEFTLRKHGRWISKGNQTGDGLVLGIGFWRHYIDPSF